MYFHLCVAVCIPVIIASIVADPYCPSLCTCKSSKTAEISSTSAESIDWIKLKCGSRENPITELKEIDLSKVTQSVVNLNLSGNVISTLSRDLHLPMLQRLDLSNNQISEIESDAFYNLTGLQKLDLSNNSIQTINKEIFKGLVNLERLMLNQNQIISLSFDVFDYLLGLKQIDLSGNPLKCDCDLIWLGEWSRSAIVRLINNPKCATPESLNGHNVKKLKILLDLVKCGLITNALQNSLLLRPQHAQVVFEGDSLTLRCKAPFSTIKTVYNLTWSRPNTTLDPNHYSVNNVDILEEGLAESILAIPQIANNDTGQYQCTYSKDNSTDLTELINIIVISNFTKYCPVTVTSNNKGVYTWPGSITGHVVTQPCHNKDGAVAYYNCAADGRWSHLNTSACPYTSETTKMLEQFALVNLSVFKGSALGACQRLNTLLLQNTLTDPDDISFIYRAIHNYMTYITNEKDLGSVLLDVVNTVMMLPAAVLSAAEDLYGSCSSIITAVENISQYATNIQGHKTNLAVERFPIKRDSFTGMTCIWYSTSEHRMLHCSTTNRTITPLLTVRDKVIQASIQIPATLLYRMDHQAMQASPGNIHRSYGLVVSMYESAALFPKLPTSNQSYGGRVWDMYGSRIKSTASSLAVTTPIVGVKLVNISLEQPLAEPVYIMVKDSAVNSGLNGRAVLWDEDTHTWSDAADGCSVVRIITNMVVIQCYKLGYVGLLQNVETGVRSGGARFKLSHPAIYVGSSILLLCLMVALLTYCLCYSRIHMPARSKHAHLNTWLGLSLLAFLYTLGVYQTEDRRLCRTLGLLLHYLSLCCLLWISVAVSQLYKLLSGNRTQTLQSPEDELPPDAPVRKPILGIYLVGWGIALIVCGISGAVNMQEYASYSHCFLSSAPALSAVFVPAGIIIVFLSIVFLLIRCTIRNVNGQSSEGTQATENVDLEMWEPQSPTDRQSQRSEDSEAEDGEHSPAVQLRAHIVVLAVYLASWTCALLVVYRPFPAYLPYQEDIFSILYALCATLLGTFILFFYGVARSDVRSQWSLMHCYLHRRKRCCRTRSVFDANADHRNLAPISESAVQQPGSRSTSRNSNRTNSNILKAAAELNGRPLGDSIADGSEAPDMSLVLVHRRQYRSDDSVTAFPQNGTGGADIFYNANQSNVARKFFKKQKKRIRRNCLDIPRRIDYDSDSQTSGMRLPRIENAVGGSDIFVSGSKINNTNIHVERGQLSDNGMKESRHRLDPNILNEYDESDDKPQLKRFVLEKEVPLHNRDKFGDVKSGNRSPLIMNIYTNVPETKVPQHQIVSSGDMETVNETGEDKHMKQCSSVSAEGLNLPTMRTVSQQCSLEYSSTSEVATPLNQLGSDKTLNTHSELTSLQETHSALCSAHEITSDTDDAHSLAKYADFAGLVHVRTGVQNSKQHTSCSKLQNELIDPTKLNKLPGKNKNRSLQEIDSRKSKNEYDDADLALYNEHYLVNDNADALESDNLMLADKQKGTIVSKPSDERFYQSERSKRNFETSSMHAGEQPFENESDIYFPNYQMSEVSIRSHGLYAPPPTSICGNDLNMTFSNGELSRNHQDRDDDCYENQYVNYNPAWRQIKEGTGSQRLYHSPAVSCPDVHRADNDSPASLVSEIDELYKQITSRDRLSKKPPARGHGDAGLRHCESDSCISESHSDILDPDSRAETRV